MGWNLRKDRLRKNLHIYKKYKSMTTKTIIPSYCIYRKETTQSGISGIFHINVEKLTSSQPHNIITCRMIIHVFLIK